MAYRYVCQLLQCLIRGALQWKAAAISYVNTTTGRVTSGSKMAQSDKCEGFYQKYFWINVK